MNYPLEANFKLLAIAQQISLRDATGNLIFYVKQKAFKLKEAVTVFADAEQTRPLFTINADRVIDFSARYHIAQVNGGPIGSIKRKGARSIWRSQYEIFHGETPVMNIREEKPWVKMVDAVFGEIPILGMFTGFFFHPSYLVTRADGTPILRVTKRRAFFEGKFVIEQQAQMHEQEELLALLSLMMMVLLERARG